MHKRISINHSRSAKPKQQTNNNWSALFAEKIMWAKSISKITTFSGISIVNIRNFCNFHRQHKKTVNEEIIKKIEKTDQQNWKNWKYKMKELDFWCYRLIFFGCFCSFFHAQIMCRFISCDVLLFFLTA